MSTVRLATRASPLARHQAGLVAARLEAFDATLNAEMVVVTTSPDEHLDRPITSFRGTGAFTAEVDQAITDGRADIAVHSAKDLPSRLGSDAVSIAAMLERTEVRDALVGMSFDSLDSGDTIRTGSVRRRSQLAAAIPGLIFEELRGNIATRLSKVPPRGAIVMAYTALQRLGLADLADDVLDPEVMLPQVGQGAIALTCREGDHRALELCSAINDERTHRAVRAERAFLSALGEGCEAPVGALCVVGDATVRLDALIARADGSAMIRRQATGVDGDELGRSLARDLLDGGGRQMLMREP